MRALFLLALLALTGCDSIGRLNADSFEIGAGGVEAYEIDAQACQQAADLPLDTDVRLMNATHYARNRAFNGLYAHCMTGRGHAPRPYVENLLLDSGAL